MNRDELIKLKEELEKSKFYCAVFNDVDNSDSRIVEIDDKRISGIEKMDQTHEVLRKCEAFIEKVLIPRLVKSKPFFFFFIKAFSIKFSHFFIIISVFSTTFSLFN